MKLSYDDIISMTEVADVVTVDTEGVSRMLGFSLCFDGLQDGFYLPFSHHGNRNLNDAQKDKIYSVLGSRSALVFHNAVHDLRVLARHGFDYRGPFYDTMLMAHWINEEEMSYALDKISQVYGGQPKNMSDSAKMVIEQEGWDNVSIEMMELYSGNDAFIEHQLFRKLLPKFQEQCFDGSLWETEQRFIRDVMGPMMDLGIKIDLAFCLKEYMKGIAEMDACLKELGYKSLGPKAYKELLLEQLELPVVKHTKSCEKCKKRAPVASHDGPPSFDKDAMKEYEFLLESREGESELVKTILRYRGWQKTTSSNYKPYMELVDEQAVLHPGYKLHGTKTGRLSCADPNLQQIPKSSDKEWNGHLKRAFVPRDGFGLWEVDYSQLQFRMTVAYARQQTLIDIFNDPDRDIFTEMASTAQQDILKLRFNTKTMVYLILFGGGAKRAADAFRITETQGKILVDKFHRQYPGLREIAAEAQRVAAALKYVEYWTGRRRHFLPGGAPTYRAFNAVIQGGEAEIMKRAMIRLQEEVCNDECRMILQVHDAIAFEIVEGKEDEYLPKIEYVMEDVPNEFCEAVGQYVRFAVESKRWGEK